ncbi:M20 family metallo-hydrolase [Photobacterium nomapromontoriensis]|uniref:M20 family metallo-hydrolase n=1 Tax=Photobacterium nomapromontoriensis TaxID=2910237 RepID=UPI003D0E3FBB
MDSTELLTIFNHIGTYGETENGMYRLAYSDADNASHDYLFNLLVEKGYDVHTDAMGNIFANIPSTDPNAKIIATGSHLDTVHCGGKYDGTVGVVAGLYALEKLKTRKLKHTVQLIIFRAEESSRFGFACMASKALTGHADLKKWLENTDSDGINFFDASGTTPSDIENIKLNHECYKSFVEVHIEQGNILENYGQHVGIVSAIAAPTRFRITVKGHADHSGATPMDLRSDALCAAARIINDIHHEAYIRKSEGTVGTVGKLDVSPNSMNVVPGEVEFTVDIRGINKDSVDAVVKHMYYSIEETSQIHHVTFDVVELCNDLPVSLDNSVCQILVNAAQDENVPYYEMNSGAGHDAMYMSTLIPSAMMFIPSKGGISHHPDEYSEFEDILLAGNILANAMEKMAS